MSDFPAGTVLNEWPVDVHDLRLGRTDEHGVDWVIEDIEGWDVPGLAGESEARSGGDGAWAGQWVRPPRQLSIIGSFEAPDPAGREAAEQRLFAAAGRADRTVTVWDEVPKWCTARLNGQLVLDRLPEPAKASFLLPMVAHDPARYGLVRNLRRTGLARTEGGTGWPAEWPETWDGFEVRGSVRVDNAGTEDALPVLTITGPAPSPLVVLAGPEGRRVLRFAVDLAVGEVLVVDSVARSVTVNGARRRGLMRGPWPVLGPGVTEVSFDAEVGFVGPARLAIEWFDTWA